MFTGLVEEMGTVAKIEQDDDSFILTITADTILTDTNFGESINVNGVCLSIMMFTDENFTVGLARETRRLTALDALAVGDRVNLERAVLPTTRLGGHYVQGHVDATGTVHDISRDGDALLIKIITPANLMRYIVRKGYICVDGTSLTVIDTGPDWFTLTLISHSQNLVTLATRSAGEAVNLEVDIMAKFAEKIIIAGSANK